MKQYTPNIEMMNEKNKTLSDCYKTAGAKLMLNLIILVSIAISSCKRFVEIEPPINRITTETAFQSDQSAISAISGLYSNMMKSNLFLTNGGVSVYTGLSSDELFNTTSNNDNNALRNNNIQTTNGIILTQIWSFGYNLIYQTNAILEGLSSSNSLTPSLKQQLEGEAKFIRGLCHFYLTNLFGDIPLITSTDYEINAVMPRITQSQLYQQIVLDLKDAKNFLSTVYPSSGKVRPNKWTASALLARVYLYLKDWNNAEAEATTVINSGLYSLDPNLNNVFLANSKEAIFQLRPVNTSNAPGDANAFIPSSTSANVKPAFALTQFVTNAFDIGDLRTSSWIKSKVVSGQTYNYPFKYKIYSSTNAPTEFNMVLRLAEQFIIRAEARAQQNNIMDAQLDLNIVRTRAGLPNTIANDKNSLLSAIEHERQVELFAEWGHRWFDLKRTGRADAILGIEKAPNWQFTDALYPIPFSELQFNPTLTQNPGY